MRNWQDVLTASRGTFAVNDSTEVTIQYYGLRIDMDGVIVLTQGATNVTQDYVSDPTEPLVAGTIIIADAGKTFTKFQAVSGKATLIKV
jgi:hypothetical protein